MKTALITGSKGFIGKHLVMRLIRDGWIVKEIDTKIGIDAIDIERYIDDVDIVFHLAAQTSVFNDDKNRMIYDNIKVFTKVCDICQKYHKKLVYTSSSCAFNITSLYGLTKHFDEQYAMIYCPNATGVRLHNVYGHNQRTGTLLYNLLHGPCTIYNGGNNKRHFTYIDDVVDGLLYASTSSEPLLNICNPKYISVNQFINEIQKYRHITNIEYTNEIRQYDKDMQYVDDNIPAIPLKYTSLEDGLKNLLK